MLSEYITTSPVFQWMYFFTFFTILRASFPIDRAIGFYDNLVKIYCTSAAAKERLGNHFHNLLRILLYCRRSLSHIRAHRKRLFGSWLHMAMSSSSWRYAQTVLQSSSQQQVLAHIAVLLKSEGEMILEQAEKHIFCI